MFIFWFVLSVISITTSNCKFYLQAGNCTPAQDYFSYYNLYIKNRALNIDMMSMKPLEQRTMVHLDIEKRGENSNRYQRLFQFDLNYCSTLTTVKDSIFKRWFQSILKHGNFSATCPIPPAAYYLHNLLVTSDMIPSFFSIPGEYRIKLRGYYRKTKIKREQLLLECLVYATL